MKTLAKLKKLKKAELVNWLYNWWISQTSDANENDRDYNDCLHGKRVPYMGWSWRHSDFMNKRISLGKTGGYVAVMENNKWGYAGRMMSEEECNIFIDFIDRAIVEKGKGGVLSNILDARNAVLLEMRQWLQTLANIGAWSEEFDW